MTDSDLDHGIKYMDSKLKPNDYKYADWLWLFDKIEARISIWCNRWLSPHGRLVLESILVYWMMSIAHIPMGILREIKKTFFSVLWTERKEKDRIPWLNGKEWQL